MSSSRALIVKVLLAGVAPAVVSACGQSSDAGGPALRGIVFAVTFSLTGTVTTSGSFTDRGSQNTPTTCADFGRQGIGGTGSPVPAPSAYFIPTAPPGQQLEGQRFSYQSLVNGYHGPDTYTDPHILVELVARDGVYTAGSTASLQLDARADGSGTARFDGFTDVSDASRTLSGQIDWTCRRAG